MHTNGCGVGLSHGLNEACTVVRAREASQVLLLLANSVRLLLRHQNEAARHLSHVLRAHQWVRLVSVRCPPFYEERVGSRQGKRACRRECGG